MNLFPVCQHAYIIKINSIKRCHWQVVTIHAYCQFTGLPIPIYTGCTHLVTDWRTSSPCKKNNEKLKNLYIKYNVITCTFKENANLTGIIILSNWLSCQFLFFASVCLRLCWHNIILVPFTTYRWASFLQYKLIYEQKLYQLINHMLKKYVNISGW